MTTQRIATLTLDENSAKHRSMEAEHERTIAMVDLLHDNSFSPIGMADGPYDVKLSIEEGRLVFDISPAQGGGENGKVALSVQPLKRIIRDYFLICESYYEALKATGSGPSKIEAIDMGRRGVHNEGSEMLRELLEGRIAVDFATARRLFTLICVLHIK